MINNEMELGDLESNFSILQQLMPGLSTISVWRTAMVFKGKAGTRKVHQVVNRFKVLLLDQPSLAEYLPPAFRGLVIYHCHQDEKEDHLKNSHDKTQWLARLRMFPQPDPETCLLQRADIVLCEGESDESNLTQLTRARPTKIPFAFDESLLRLSGQTSHRLDRMRLIYVADTSNDVVLKPLERFLTLHWTAIRRLFPSLIFEVSLPSTDCLDQALISPGRNVHATPFNGRWLDLLGQSCLFVNPVAHPASMSQMLNAMAMGFPAMGPSSVRRQLPARLPFLTMDTVDEAVSQIGRACMDQLLWKRCANARITLEETCSISRLTYLLVTALTEATQVRRAPDSTMRTAKD